MATSRTATLSLWRIGGFPNHHALEKALAELRAAGLMRPSRRGGAAQQLDPHECAAVALAMRGEVNTEETTRFAALPREESSGGAVTLADRLAHILAEGADGVLSGTGTPEVSIALKSGARLEAEVKISDEVEHFGEPGAAAPAGVRKIVEIPPNVWVVLCELAADTARKARGNDCRGNAPGGATRTHNAHTAARPCGRSGLPRAHTRGLVSA